MRIGLDYSSSASTSSAESQEELEEEDKTTIILPLSSSPTPRRESKTQSRSRSNTPFANEQIKLSNLDRINEIRQNRRESQQRKLRSSTPKWMRDSTPIFNGDDNNSDSETDSEEEQWPVRPGKTGTGKQDLPQRIRLASETIQDFPLRARSIAANRRSLINSRQTSNTKTYEKTITSNQKDIDEVANLLSRIKFEREKQEQSESNAFDERNRLLWESIEQGIKLAEEVKARQQREEDEKKRHAKEQEEAAERKAKEVKQAKEAQEKQERERNEEEKRRQKERKEAEEKAAAEEAKSKEASKGIGNNLIINAQKEYDKWFAIIKDIKEKVLPAVSQNSEWRKQCFGAKRIITRSIGQLTNSRQEIIRITQTIHDVLTQAKGASPNGEIYTWILNHLSKCLIRQAEQEVAAKQEAAFPLARVVVWLMLEGHSQLGDVLMARLSKKCCWSLAFCPRKEANQDETAYAKLIGKSDKEESSVQYVTRMSGIMAMYFAICQVKPSTPPNSQAFDAKFIPLQFRPVALWSWQVRILTPAMCENAIVPALFSVLLEIAGPILLQLYGRQCIKLWTSLYEEGLKQRKAGFSNDQSANSSRVRLQMLLEDWQKAGGNSLLKGITDGREMEI